MSGPRYCLSRMVLAGAGLILAGLLAAPASAQPVKPSGAEVWAANCGRCHRLRAVDAYGASQWDAVVAHMSLNARMTPDETEAVRQFLVEGARARQAAAPGSGVVALAPDVRQFAFTGVGLPLPSLPRAVAACSSQTGPAIFKAQCVVCHGAKGKGDGPAAAALNPRPSNLSDAGRMAKLSDDSLAKVLTTGRNAMPAFGKILKPEELRDVAAYLRCLSGAHPPAGSK